MNTTLPGTTLPGSRQARPAVGSRPVTALALLLAGLLVAGLAVVAPAPAAHAAARVSVSGLDGAASASPDGPTTLRLGGSGFQSVPKGFGGIYVLFGWVSDPSGGSWRPSAGGATGEDLRYVPDSEAADNAGYQRFVSFPGSTTAAEANGGTVSADGRWAADLVVPGARFQTVDRSGSAVEVDCTQVQCGVITIGAHGVSNAANETFTPVSFTGGGSTASGATGSAGTDATDDSDDSGAGGSGDAGAGQDAGGDAAPKGAAETPAGATTQKKSALPGKATLGVDKATAVAGRVLSFAGQGFAPGEQAVATLDGGVLAVGPLTVGNHGEVAGLLELPGDLRLGTHVLKVTGASSERAPEVEVIVTRDPAEAEAADALVAAASTERGAGPGVTGLAYSPAELAVGGALLLLLVVVVASAVTGARRRRAARAAVAADATPSETTPSETTPSETTPSDAEPGADA